MIRRSARLLSGGYYLPDDDRIIVSYHETYVGRIFKRRTLHRTSVGSVAPPKQAATQRVTHFSIFSTPTLKQLPSTYTFPPPAPSTALRAPVPDLLVHSPLLRRDLRRPSRSLTIGFILLALGFWYYPFILLHISMVTSPITGLKDSETDDMGMLRNEIFGLLAVREAKWKDTWATEKEMIQKEMALLKRDTLKEEYMSEILKTELLNLSEDLEHPVWFQQQLTSVYRQISDLKTSVTSLHATTYDITEHINSLENVQANNLSQLKEELSAWLAQQLASGSGSYGSAVLHAEMKRALEGLETDVMNLVRENMKKEWHNQQQNVREMLQREREGGLSKQDVLDIIQRELRLFRADGVGIADYALESIGASVIHSHCSDTYQPRTTYYSLYGIPLFYHSETPRTIIQPDVDPGKCWAFNGEEGFATIALAHTVHVTHVTLEHVPRELSPTGNINSAPKDFSIYGIKHVQHDEGTLLGSFTYNRDAEPVQTFELPESGMDVFKTVQLRVKNNLGHPKYTCIYRFRVHGMISHKHQHSLTV